MTPEIPLHERTLLVSNICKRKPVTIENQTQDPWEGFKDDCKDAAALLALVSFGVAVAAWLPELWRTF